MLSGVEEIFTDMKIMMKKLKKSSYEKNMNTFRQNYKEYFQEMVFFVDDAEDSEKAAKEVAGELVDRVEQKYAVKGRIGGRMQADLNFFMIYYVFPAILLEDDQNGRVVADAICREWGARFKESNIRYADYDTIYNGFREKIFGIF